MFLPILFMILTLIILATFSMQRKHLLMSILTLETAILWLVVVTVWSFGLINQLNTFLFIIILTFSACESALGLCLLIALMRYFGNDSISVMMTNKC